MRFLTYPNGDVCSEWIANKLGLVGPTTLDVHFDPRVIALFMSDPSYSFAGGVTRWLEVDQYSFSAECWEVPDGTVIRFTHGEESGCEYFEIDQAATRINQMRALGAALTLETVHALLAAPPITAVQVIPFSADE